MLNNLGVKIGAFCVALLLWLHVVTEKTYTYTFQAALNPVHLDKSLIIANELPEYMQAKVQGKGKHLLWLMLSKRTITLELNNADQRNTRYHLKPADVVVPRDLDVTVVELEEPAYVDVDIDRLMSRKVRVQPRLAVQAAAGYTAAGLTASTPDSAILIGPQRYVEDVDTLFSRPATVERVREPLVRQLLLEPPQGVHVTVRPAMIEARIDIQKLRQRVITDIPVTLINVPAQTQARLDEPAITLTVEGGEGAVASLTSHDFHVLVDYHQALRDSARIASPVIRTPPLVTCIEARPQTFRVLSPRS